MSEGKVNIDKIVEGDGKTLPRKGNIVSVTYTGYITETGQIFDTTAKRRRNGEEIPFEIDAFRRSSEDTALLPAAFRYKGLPGLSAEEQEILQARQPASVHAAGRIPGVRPSTLMLLFGISNARDRSTEASRLAHTR